MNTQELIYRINDEYHKSISNIIFNNVLIKPDIEWLIDDITRELSYIYDNEITKETYEKMLEEYCNDLNENIVDSEYFVNEKEAFEYLMENDPKLKKSLWLAYYEHGYNVDDIDVVLLANILAIHNNLEQIDNIIYNILLNLYEE